MKWLQTKLNALKSINEETILFYLDTGNTFHIPKYYEVSYQISKYNVIFNTNCKGFTPMVWGKLHKGHP